MGKSTWVDGGFIRGKWRKGKKCKREKAGRINQGSRFRGGKTRVKKTYRTYGKGRKGWVFGNFRRSKRKETFPVGLGRVSQTSKDVLKKVQEKVRNRPL